MPEPAQTATAYTRRNKEFPMTETISISVIKTDGGTQMRSCIDPETVLLYSEHIRDGAEFPPITVFYDGKDYWLADGFHRCDAYLAAAQDFIPADIRSGSRLDAVVYALKANAANGRPRTSTDLQRAYRVAVDNKLCDAGDVAKVKDLIGCSDRWARELTKAARESIKTERNHKIVELAEQGKSQREIAAEVGVSHQTVMRATGPERKPSFMDQPRSYIEKNQQEQPTSRGVGIRYAHEAIAVLNRIPLSDGLRQDAFDMVIDWIETNRG
jgi:hypothetical protein